MIGEFLLPGIIGAAPVVGLPGPAMFRPYRAIGQFTADVTVMEEHTDELQITDHPVEQGANISDHAFKLPMRVTIRAGWSDSTSPFTLQVKYLYQQLLTLQASRIPFDVYTGKRAYKNMLIQSLMAITNEETENSLVVTAHLREVNLVATQTTTVPSNATQKDQTTTSAPSSAEQAQPSAVPAPSPAPPSIPTASGGEAMR